MSNLTKYNSYDVEAAADDAEEAKRAGGGDFAKPADGENQYRFLPPIGEMRTPFVTVHKHFINLPGMSKVVVVNCPRLMAKRDCVICRRIEQMRARGDAASADIADKMFPQLRVYANVIDRSNEALGPVKLEFGKKVYEALVALRTSKAGGDFTDPSEDGFDIIITKTGQMLNTRYTVTPMRESTPLSEDAAQVDAWISEQANLLIYQKVPTTEEIEKLCAEAGVPGLAGSGSGARSAEPPARGASRGAAPAPAASRPRTRTAADDMNGGDPE